MVHQIQGGSSNQNQPFQPRSFPFDSGSPDLNRFQNNILTVDNGLVQLHNDLKTSASEKTIKTDIDNLKIALFTLKNDFENKGGDALELHYHVNAIFKISDYLNTLNQLDLSLDNKNLQADLEKAYPTVENLEGFLMNNFH